MRKDVNYSEAYESKGAIKDVFRIPMDYRFISRSKMDRIKSISYSRYTDLDLEIRYRDQMN